MRSSSRGGCVIDRDLIRATTPWWFDSAIGAGCAGSSTTAARGAGLGRRDRRAESESHPTLVSTDLRDMRTALHRAGVNPSKNRLKKPIQPRQIRLRLGPRRGPALPAYPASMAINVTDLVRIGQGREAEVFALDTERVIKVARGAGGQSLEREATVRAAHAAGMPVPAAHELIEVDGRRALVMGRARGTDMLTGFARKPWTLTYAIAGERESLLAAIEAGPT
jgi:hypothetical protein